MVQLTLEKIVAKLKLKIGFLAFSLLTLAACEQATTYAPKPQSVDDYIKLSYGECFGTCPVFDIQLFGSGKLIYTGKKHVKMTGTEVKEVDPALFTQIEELLAVYKGDALTDPKVCPIRATDMPAVSGEMHVDGKSRVISHYFGCRGYAWRAEQEQLIDDIGALLNIEVYSK